jgi:AraC family transcriptional regulator
MNPVGKALWFIESHFASEITLGEIADVAGVSRYHLTRAFGDVTGHSVMRYVRGRRLSEAARTLAEGARDILTVALDAGYGSHEAFTRAFHEQFDLTPEAIRRQGHLGDVQLLEPIKMEEAVGTSVPIARFENGKVLLIGGIVQRYTCETSAGIPSQWQRFLHHIGGIPGQVGQPLLAFAGTAMKTGASTTSAACKCPTFRRCPLNLLTSEFPRRSTRCFLTASTSRPSGAPGPRSGTSGCRNQGTSSLMRQTSNATPRSSTPERGPVDSRFGYQSKRELVTEHCHENINCARNVRPSRPR